MININDIDDSNDWNVLQKYKSSMKSFRSTLISSSPSSSSSSISSLSASLFSSSHSLSSKSSLLLCLSSSKSKKLYSSLITNNIILLIIFIIININSMVIAEINIDNNNNLANTTHDSNDKLINEIIILNQTVKAPSTTTTTTTTTTLAPIIPYNNDELILKKLLEAANMTQPPPETWRAIVNLLTKGLNDHLQSRYPLSSSNQINNRNKNIKNKIINNDDDEQNITIPKSTKTRIESAIDEFPPDFMSDDLRQKGGFVVHIIMFVYFSLALAVICDDYFLKSLEYISEALHLPSDIAGATFMAIGTSAPELFTSVIGVFISDNDIGTGTIVGSAVFNLIAIPGACGFAAYYNLKNMPKINPFPIIRDTIFYVLTIITLILCIKDNRVDWVESITLIALYIVYIIIMYFNAQLSHIVEKSDTFHHHHHSAHHEYIEVSSTKLNDINELDTKRQQKQQHTNTIEIHSETQPLLLTDDSVKRLSPPPAYQSGGNTYAETAHQQSSHHDQQQQQPRQSLDLSKIHLTLADNGKFKEIKTDHNQIERKQTISEIIDLEQQSTMIDRTNVGDDDDEISDINDIDADWSSHPIIQFLLFPFKIIFFFTLPKPTRFCFVLTFISSIIWIACLTYFIVWMVTLVGYTLGIPDTISGITVLAAGTSIPELISSYLIVKKAGLADMAICNSIGSNIFDILFCLGLPWLLKSSIVIIANGFNLTTLATSFIPIQSQALPITSLTLLLTIGAMIFIFRASKWCLNLQLGILCLLVYVLFVVTSISLELNI